MKKLLLAAALAAVGGMASADDWSSFTDGASPSNSSRTLGENTSYEQAAINKYNSVITALNTNVDGASSTVSVVEAIQAVVQEQTVIGASIPEITGLAPLIENTTVDFTTAAGQAASTVSSILVDTDAVNAKLAVKEDLAGPGNAAFSIRAILLTGSELAAVTGDTVPLRDGADHATIGYIGMEYAQLEQRLNQANLLGYRVSDPSMIADTIALIVIELTAADNHKADLNAALVAYNQIYTAVGNAAAGF